MLNSIEPTVIRILLLTKLQIYQSFFKFQIKRISIQKGKRFLNFFLYMLINKYKDYALYNFIQIFPVIKI